MNDAKLGDFLQRIGVITPQQLHTAREVVSQDNLAGRGRLANVLVKMGFVTHEELARLAATALRMPYVSLDRVTISKDLIRLLDKEEARKAKGVIVKVDGKKFYLATADPMNMVVFDELQFKLGGQIYPVVTTEEEAFRTVGHYYTERIVIDRPFDLPDSSTLDYSKPEVFDIKGVRAAKLKKEKKLEVPVSAEGVARKAAAQDRLAAAASQVKVTQPANGADEPSKPAAPAFDMPKIRDADELEAAPVDEAPIEAEVQEELEVVELDAQEEAVAGEVIEDELEPLDQGELEPVELETVEPEEKADDLLGLFGSLLGGGAPAADSPSQATDAETQELAMLFMGALGGDPNAAASAGQDAPKNEEADAMAKELAAMLLGE